MRALYNTEVSFIQQIAEKLDSNEKERLLADLRLATVATVTADKSRIIFSLKNYQRPPYRGQHPYAGEGRMSDRDGGAMSILLHADENNRLFEIEIIRWDGETIVDPDWTTLLIT